jgi:hypothetical protein
MMLSVLIVIPVDTACIVDVNELDEANCRIVYVDRDGRYTGGQVALAAPKLRAYLEAERRERDEDALRACQELS